jgi:peptide/nickel transport system substrate-binding protein
MLLMNSLHHSSAAGRRSVRGRPTIRTFIPILFALAAALIAPLQASAQQLVTAITSNPPTLDPQRTFSGFSFSVTGQIYETLVRLGPDSAVTAGLATAWERPAPGVLRLELREGVRFHDGSPLDAAAVVASLERLLDPDTGAQGRFVVASIDAVRAIGPNTVEIVSEPPFAPLLAHLAHPVTAIVPTLHTDTLDRRPLGSGPFRFVSWRDGDRIELEANPDYWGGAPAIASLVFRIVPELSTQIVELRSGGLDLIYNLPPDAFVGLAGVEGVTRWSLLGFRSSLLGFNLEHPKLSDVRVRRAIAHAIDRRSLVDAFLLGMAEPAVAPLPSTVRFAAELDDPYPYDPDRAQQLLRDAGAEGLELRLDIFRNADIEAVAQLLQAMLADAGIALEIRVQDFAAWDEAVKADDAELWAAVWSTITLDADYTLYAFLHSSEIPQNNLSRYRDPEVDALLERARVDASEAGRRETYLEVQRRVVEELPLMALYHPLATYAKRDGLNGERITFSWIDLDLRSATLSE